MPPKVPKHPLQDVELNMNEVLTYSHELSFGILHYSHSGIMRHYYPYQAT